MSVGPGTVFWSDAAAWSNGVANGAGALATLDLAPGSTGSVALGLNPVTLEQLRIQGRGSTTLSGLGPMTFQNDGDGELLLELAPIDGELATTMAIPITWATEELLRVATGAQGNLILNRIATTSGHMQKTGAGSLRLNATNAGWNGNFEIVAGTVTAAHAQALGTAVGSTTVRSGGRLVLQYTNAEPIVIDGGVVQVANLDLNGPISVSGGATIHRARNPVVTVPRDGEFEQQLGVTNLNGVISGDGNLTIRNESRDAIIIRGNNTYAGHTSITQGQVNAMTPSALGGSSEGTTVSGGTLSLYAALAEPMFVRGGSLVFATSAATAGPITLQTGLVNLGGVNYAQPIALDEATNATILGSGVLSGGIAGTGDVTLRGNLVVNGAPISNQGDLILSGTGSQPIRLESANTFTGSLIVTAGEVVVDHQQAMSGRLLLSGGRVTIARSDINVSTEIRANRGVLQTAGEVSGPIILEGTIGSSGFIGGRLTGQISGRGDVEFIGRDGNAQTISGANTFEGVAAVVGGGTVNATSGTAFGSDVWATVVSSGTLNVNAATNEKFFVGTHGILNLNAPVSRLPKMLAPGTGQLGVQQVSVNAPSSFVGASEAAYGRLQVNANSSAESLLIRESGRVSVAAGASLHVAGDIELWEGQLEGSVTGASTIRKTSFGGAVVKAIPQFAGQIVVEQGVLEAYSGGLGTASGSTRVARGAQLMTRGIGVIADDIYLEDALGPQNRGGLYMGAVCCSGSTTVMNGRLDLGPNGSIIGGGGNVNDEILRINTPVSGGSLTTWGSGISLHLANANNTYTGVTDVRQGILTLVGNGRLSRTSAIVLRESEGSYDGTLNIDNQAGANVDRVGAQVPIEFRGGRLSGFGGGSEAFGTLRFAEGRSEIDARDMALAANRIERETGSILYAELSGPIAVAEAPENSAGLLPWMLVRPGTYSGPGPQYELFGAYANGQIHAMDRAPISTNINAATAADNVGVTVGGATLTGDRTVNSLLLAYRGVLDLGGHSLTVASGGISTASGEIRNGNITAAAGQELMLHGGGWINANIVDGADGPLDVTVTSAIFGGDNSFTGKLYVNELMASFRTENSLPAGIDIDVIGGNFEAAYTPTQVKHLGKLRIAGGGRVTKSGQFSFEEVALEYGDLQVAKLAGDGPIRKTTIGTSYIDATQRTDASYTGTISVDDGILNVLGLPGASFEVNGGRLRLEQASNRITLNGGEIEFRSLSGPIAINGPTTMISYFGATSAAITGPLTGAGELTFNSSAQFFDAGDFSRNAVIGINRNNSGFSGNVHVQAADVTVSQNDALGTGQITVHAGGSLRLSGTFGAGFANQVVLDGGTLRGTSSSRVAGTLRVASASYVGGVDIVGDAYLEDASLMTYSSATTRFLGKLHVGGESKLVLGRDVEAIRGSVELGGTILADKANSTLNITRGGLDELLFTASLHADAGRSLQLRLDDAPMSVAIAAGAKISGEGRLVNDIRLGSGASASPGTSLGTLTIDGDLTFEPGSRFDLELAAGQNDKLVVNGLASIGGGMLNIALLDGYLPSANDVFAILEADTLAGMFTNAQGLKSIANGWRVDWNLNQVGADVVLKAAAVAQQGDFTGNGIVDGDDLAAWKAGYGLSNASHQQGDANGDGLVDGGDFLVWQRQFSGVVSPPESAVVPEPGSASLLVVAAMAAAWRRRLRESELVDGIV